MVGARYGIYLTSQAYYSLWYALKYKDPKPGESATLILCQYIAVKPYTITSGEFYPTIKEGHDAHVVGQFSSSQNPHVDQSGWIRNFVNYYLPAIPISKPDNDEIILRDAHQVLPKALVQIRFE